MFRELSESARRHRNARRALPAVTASITLHGTLIWAGVVLTARAAPPPAIPIVIRDDIPWVSPDQPHPNAPVPDEWVLPSLPPAPSGEIPLPGPLVPDGIPPVDPTPLPPFDPRKSVAGPAGGQRLGGPFSARPGEGCHGGERCDIRDERAVDAPPELLSRPFVPYPESLRELGLEGHALVEVVIDTAGVPERGSLRVLELSHSGFASAVRELVLRSRYRPGQLRGRPVRVLVRFAVVFQLDRRRTAGAR
jgi:hypothetical protein